jgi:hypothetical protein
MGASIPHNSIPPLRPAEAYKLIARFCRLQRNMVFKPRKICFASQVKGWLSIYETTNLQQM